MFTDEAFSAAFAEMETPQLSEYEFFVTCQDINIYRHYDSTSGLYEYKCSGHLNLNCELMHDVYMDLQYRNKWDSYVKELYETTCPVNNDTGNGGDTLIYWNVNFPFPLSNRDYTYVRESRRFGDDAWVILAEAALPSVSNIPEKKGVIRVNEYKQFIVIQTIDEKKTKFYMHYFDNPGGSIPTWLINWAAKTGVPAFVSDMEKACAGYDKYLAKQEK